MPPQAIEPRRLYQQIADRLKALIASGKYTRGARLPAERAIALQMGVSRTAVREALIALEIGGFVEVRGGSGIYVSAGAGRARPLFDLGAAGPGPFELLRARRMVEGEIAALAASAIDAAGIAALEETLVVLASRKAGPGERDTADRQFHLGIAQATGNSALVQTVRMYWTLRRDPMWRRIAEHFDTPELRAAVIVDHGRIIVALAAGDSARARRAMHHHLDRVEREFARAWKAVPESAPLAAAAALSVHPGLRRARTGT